MGAGQTKMAEEGKLVQALRAEAERQKMAGEGGLEQAMKAAIASHTTTTGAPVQQAASSLPPQAALSLPPQAAVNNPTQYWTDMSNRTMSQFCKEMNMYTPTSTTSPTSTTPTTESFTNTQCTTNSILIMLIIILIIYILYNHCTNKPMLV